MRNKNLKRNAEGYIDLTPYNAIKNIDKKEEEHFNKTLRTIFSIAELSGFRVEGRITLVNVTNGRVWR